MPKWESGVDEGVRFDDRAKVKTNACVDATSHVYQLATDTYNSWMVNTGITFGVLLVLTFLLAHLYRVYRRPSRPTKISPRLQALTAEMIRELSRFLHLSERPLEVHLDTEFKQPVAIKSRRHLTVLTFGADFAMKSEVQPRLAGALLAHELSHHFQWDTGFGHVWLQVSLSAGAGLCLISLFGCLIIGVRGVAELMGHHYAAYRYSLRYLAVGLAFSSCFVACCLFAKRWLEYHADLTAVLCGYGPEMRALLGTLSAVPRSFLSRLRSAGYPSNAARLRRLSKVQSKFPDTVFPIGASIGSAAGVEVSRLRIADYAGALCIYVAPTMIVMGVATRLFVHFANKVGQIGLPGF